MLTVTKSQSLVPNSLSRNGGAGQPAGSSPDSDQSDNLALKSKYNIPAQNDPAKPGQSSTFTSSTRDGSQYFQEVITATGGAAAAQGLSAASGNFSQFTATGNVSADNLRTSSGASSITSLPPRYEQFGVEKDSTGLLMPAVKGEDWAQRYAPQSTVDRSVKPDSVASTSVAQQSLQQDPNLGELKQPLVDFFARLSAEQKESLLRFLEKLITPTAA